MNIHIDDLSATYGEKTVLSHISVTFADGKLTGLIGPNGSGKSTLLKCIYRVLSPCDGKIWIGGRVLSNLSCRESAKTIAVLAQQHSDGFDFSVKEIVLMGRTPYKGILEGDNAEDLAIAKQAMEETGLSSMEGKSFSGLSGGEQQRVLLARALTQRTPCLILDEPTNHLDITYQLQIMDLVSTRHLTVVAAIHDLNIAAMYCDSIVALKDGQVLAEGTPEEILTSELIADLYHVQAHIMKRQDGRPAIIYEKGAG